jgi:hypothetical protein
MKKLLVVLVLGIAAFQVYKISERKTFESHTKKRVEGMLANLQKGRVADEQDAIGFWKIGRPMAPAESDSNEFANFRSRGGLGAVQSYSITSATYAPADSTEGEHVDVAFVVNGKPMKIRARPVGALEWAP